MYPVQDLTLLGSQSTKVHIYIQIQAVLVLCGPLSLVFLRHLKMVLTALECDFLGLCPKRHTWLTANEMLGLVLVLKHNNIPQMA